MLRSSLLVAALCLLPTACGNDRPAPSPDAPPAPKPENNDAPDPSATAPATEQRETTDGAVLESIAVPEAKKESAFDSNQWNTAVGGGAGGRYGGRHARVMLSAGSEAEPSNESYAEVDASSYLLPADNPLSTFAADVDTASFTNVRRMLVAGELPPKDAVRLEEFVNAMSYDVPPPDPRQTFAVQHEVARCPWNPTHELVRLTVNTRPIDRDKVPPCNLVFLIDVSGSMSSANKLPLLQQSLDLLIRQLRPQDHVAIVTYARGVQVPLASARGDEQGKIRAAVQALRSSGGTNGQGGIQAAYEIAKKHQVPGVNRVLLATDGDFNIGISDVDALEQFITERKDDGTFLTVLGFGTGNLKDDRLERLADKGNGVYQYIDTLNTARRVLVEQFGASMMTVAKDVKLQTEWNQDLVRRYRLLGYENRVMAARDFRDDQKDGGEIGAGHVVTALYEIERKPAEVSQGDLLATLRVRFKPPEGDVARELTHPIEQPAKVPATLSPNGRTAATATALALLLRQDEHAGDLDLDKVAAMAEDLDQQRSADLIEVIRAARKVKLAAVEANHVIERGQR